MGIKVKDVTATHIEELRQKFNSKYASSPPAAPFHPKDIDRIRNENIWLQRFLEMYDLDMEMSFTKLWETCAWRQSYGANDLSESQLNQEYLKEGSTFVHSSDIDGKPLLIFRVRLHNKSKNLDELIRIVIYWIERTQREQHMTQLTVFFDMAGTGLATMDLDFVKRIVETFKMYYPNTLNYILVFELAWVLNAAFKVIKALLPPKAVEILKMISKKDVNQYISKDKCLASWGGSDNYEFSFVAERKQPPQAAANGGDDEQLKKVHFANTPAIMLKESNIGEPMHTPSEGMLQLDQTEFINFNPQNAEATIKLSSIAKVPVTYKIQTTSPEKFRVRPRCGIIAPNETTEINIWLKSEHQLSEDSKDKFLVMAMLAPGKECSQSEVAELWAKRTSGAGDVEQHRLVCRFADKGKDGTDASAAGGAAKGGSSDHKPMDVHEQTVQNAKQLACMQTIVFLMLGIIILLMCGFSYLMYQQMYHTTGCSASQKTAAFSCPHKRK